MKKALFLTGDVGSSPRSALQSALGATTCVGVGG